MKENARLTIHNTDWAWFIVLLFSVIWLLFAHSRAYSTNDASRMAAIESLVHRSTWVIDESPFAHTLDKIKVGDHFYSDKPPMLAFMGGILYYGLHHGLGFTLQYTGCEPGQSASGCLAIRELAHTDWAYVVLTFVLVSLPATIILALAYKLARFYGWTNPTALFFVLTLGLGTALFPYSTVFTNHVPAAMGLFIALYLLLRNPTPSRRVLMWAGFWAMLAVTIDLSAALFFVAFAVYLVWHGRLSVFWYLAGALAPGLLFIFLNFQIVGNPFPPQFYAPGMIMPALNCRRASPAIASRITSLVMP
jgi:hypothetical protein